MSAQQTNKIMKPMFAISKYIHMQYYDKGEVCDYKPHTKGL